MAYLPTSPIPTSLSLEFEREMGRKRAAHDLDDEDDWQAQSSIMFPTPPTTSAFPRAPNARQHSRTLSSSSAPAVNRYARAAVHEGDGSSEADEPAGYGADSAAETRSMHMGGSRPPSTLRQPNRRPHKRSSVAFSVASEADTVATGLGYLFLNDARDGSTTPPTGDMPQDPDAAPAVRSVQRTTAGERSTRGVALENELEPPVPAIPASIVDGMYGGTAVRYKGESQHFNSEQAWYYLRELVGQELRLEEGVLWKLSSLAGDDDDMFASVHPDEDVVDAREVPLLRYLIRHFLLTLPLIRDTSRSDSDTPEFWTSGLQVLIRKVHDADLAHDVDTSSTSLGSTIYGTFVHHALERFVSAGLKLSSGRQGEDAATNPLVNLDFEPREHPLSPTAPIRIEKGAYTSSPSSKFSLGKFLRQSPSAGASPAAVASSTFGTAVQPDAEAPTSRVPLVGSNAHFPTTSRTDVSTRGAALARTTSRQTAATTAHDDASFVSAREMNSQASAISDSEENSDVPAMLGHDLSDSSEAEDDGDGDTVLASPSTQPIASWFPWQPTGELVPPQNDILLPPTPPSHSPSGTSGESSSNKALPQRPIRSADALRPYIVGDEFDAAFQDGRVLSKAYITTFNAAATSPVVDDSLRTFPARTTSRPTVAGKQDTTVKRLTGFSLSSLLRKKISPTIAPLSPPTSPPIASPTSPASPSSFTSNQYRLTSLTPGAPFVPTMPSNLLDLFPASRRAPSNVATPIRTPNPQSIDTWVAAMSLPNEFERSSAPVSSAPLAVDLVPKGGAPWPFGAPVPFYRGVPYQRLKWGGFEVDIVAVRTTLFSKSFILRVRRPGRLDEYVNRSEAQFIKYFRVLEKQYPNAQIRRVPVGDPKNDQLPRPKAAAVGSTRPLSTGTVRSVAQPQAGPAPSVSASRPVSGPGEAAGRSSPTTSKRSAFTRSLSAQSLNGDAKPSRRRRATLSHDVRPHSMSSIRTNFTIPAHLSTPVMKRLPPHDPQRRALRNWLRDTLAVRTVGHHKETAAFLLLGSIVPRQADIKELRLRQAVDEARQQARVAVAQGAADRAKVMKDAWSSVEEECIHGNGFANISEALRTSPTIEKLPSRYVKTIDWMRMSFAETLYETLVASNTSGALFGKIKALHAAFPYFLVKGAFKIGKSKLMAKVLQDILLARPFGAKSLLQKILATCLDDDPVQLLSDLSKYRSRIGSPAMTNKLDAWAYGDPAQKNTVRAYARENNLELVLCILRGGDEPRLPPAELDQILEAGTSYRKFMKKRPSQLAKATTDDMNIRLVLDLQMYLRLVCRDRDANNIRQMLGDEETAAALEVVAGPFIDLIKRVYRVGNGASALGDLQKALDQLIIIVEALRSRVQDPQKAVRILSRLLARHQQSLYTFLHLVHRGDSIVEEFIQWGWTASVFLRRGLAQTIDLDALIPQEKELQTYLFEEVQELVDYHHKKRMRQYQNVCRRYAGDVDADDPVIVEGDGRGKSQVEPHVEPKPRCPPIIEIPFCVDAFRQQLKQVFAA